MTKTYLRYPWVLVFSLVSGCAVGDFMGTYFNTYYNAEHLFREAETAVLTAPANKQVQADTAFLPPFNVPADAKTKFASVIEKCSKILQYHPSSSLVDDALLMIGKSFYYQNENVKAERKFKELLDGYPESDLSDEARLLLAQTYYREDDKQKAYAAARDANDIAVKNGKTEIAAQLSTLLAEIDLENKNIDRAREFYQRAAELGGNGEAQASAYLKVADMYIQELQFSNALEAYRNANNASTNYVTEYRAKIGIARMLARLGDYERSLSRLNALRASTNNKEFFGDIDLEIGNVYRDKADYRSAIDQYRYVDTSYARTEVAARGYYELGLMYETRLFQYDSARVTYNKGKNEFASAPVTALLVRRAGYLNKYFTTITDIAKYDSIRTQILHPDVPEAVKPDTASTDSAGIRHVQKIDSSATAHPRIIISLDSVDEHLAFDKTELGGLFYASIGRPDSARTWYARVLREHRNSAFAARAQFMLAQIYGQDSTVAHATVDSLYRGIVDRYPESEFADEARRLLGMPPRKKLTDPADSLFLLGERLQEDGQQTAAINVFTSLVRRYPSAHLASKAQYVIGWLYEQMNTDPDSTIAQYRKLVAEYPSSVYAERVRPKLAYLDSQKHAGEASKDSLATHDQKKNPDKEFRDESPLGKGKRLNPEEPDQIPKSPRLLKETPRDTTGRTLQ